MSSFSDLYAFYLFIFCCITLVRTSSAMLNRSGKSRHPCFDPIFSEKAFIKYDVTIRNDVSCRVSVN